MGRSEAELDADWTARRAALEADKAPTMVVALAAIKSEVEDLLRLADATAAGKVPLVDFMVAGRPGEACAVQALMLSRLQ